MKWILFEPTRVDGVWNKLGEFDTKGELVTKMKGINRKGAVHKVAFRTYMMPPPPGTK